MDASLRKRRLFCKPILNLLVKPHKHNAYSSAQSTLARLTQPLVHAIRIGHIGHPYGDPRGPLWVLVWLTRSQHVSRYDDEAGAPALPLMGGAILPQLTHRKQPAIEMVARALDSTPRPRYHTSVLVDVMMSPTSSDEQHRPNASRD